MRTGKRSAMISLGGAVDVADLTRSKRRGEVDQLYATVSGSFRRAMSGVQEAVYALTDAGVRVLSPADPRVVAQIDDFLFVASDRLRAVKPVQRRHLAAIEASDFVWLVAPDGYVGLSAAMEVGCAVASETPVYSCDRVADLTIREFVTVVPHMASAIALARDKSASGGRTLDVLLDPVAAIDAAHADLDQVVRDLTESGGDGRRLQGVATRLDRSVVSPLR
jgi:hypothetical protein